MLLEILVEVDRKGRYIFFCFVGLVVFLLVGFSWKLVDLGFGESGCTVGFVFFFVVV